MKPATGASTGVCGRLTLFGALSRTPHGALEVAEPGLAAMLVVGGLPPWPIVGLGLLTAFAGYTAVYAINDLVDLREDRARIRKGGYQDTEITVELGMVRHPVAQGRLSLKAGLLWTVAWALVALTGAYLLNPVCALIFLAGAGLEVVYCLLLRVTPYRALLHGVIKNAGPMAAVFAVRPDPPALFLTAFFLWIFFWEIGGQNVAGDWHDLDEDRQMRSRTVPLLLGPSRTGRLILGSLLACVVVSPVPLLLSPAPASPVPVVLVLLAGGWFLLRPAWRLLRTGKREQAGELFSSATLYVPVVFLIAGIGLLV